MPRTPHDQESAHVERLLRALREDGFPSLPSAARVGAAALAAGVPVEQWLVEHGGIPREEILRALMTTEGVYALPFGRDWVRADLARTVTLEEARALGILPLAVRGDLLFCLDREGEKREERAAQAGLRLVPLGTLEDPEREIERLYRGLERMDGRDGDFLDFLVDQDLVGREEIHRAVREKRKYGGRLRDVLFRMGLQQDAFYEALAAWNNVPYYTTADLLRLVDPPFARGLSNAFCDANSLLPLKIAGGQLWAATSRPLDHEMLQDITAATGAAEMRLGLASEDSISCVLHTLHDAEQRILESGESAGCRTPAHREILREGDREEAEIPRQVRRVLTTAVERRASDIHIECYEDRVEMKYRIDGSLVPVPDSPLDPSNVRAALARIKILSGLDISERRRPQDGAMRIRFGEGQIDFRIAIQPTIWGENAVIRILDKSVALPALDDLGLPPEVVGHVRRLLRNPQGMLLLTGPTGCGKTTTLYAMLQEIKGSDRKILTAEDPVEYAVDGIQQSSIDEAIGNTFDRYLRAFLRQDPDIILVGEIRDAETAAMTVRAAMTGHLLLSTLHVDDAVGTVRRLTNLGVDPNLLSQTLLGVVSQRLARKLCTECSEAASPADEVLDELYPEGPPDGVEFREGLGCVRCHHTGYAGRTALAEFWRVHDADRALIDRGAEEDELWRQFLDGGGLPLPADALAKAERGLTSLEELLRVLPYRHIRRYQGEGRRTPRPALARGA